LPTAAWGGCRRSGLSANPLRGCGGKPFRPSIEVKIEVNFVLRGTVNPVRVASFTPLARENLQADLEIPVVSPVDLYGGKLVAAMDRLHPRDLFDVLQLFAHEGITDGIRRAFVVQSRDRPSLCNIRRRRRSLTLRLMRRWLVQP
jgi:predicted nucleotidyltransferase component of viral defense system